VALIQRDYPGKDFFFSKRDATVLISRRPLVRVSAVFEAPSLVDLVEEHAAELGVCIPSVLAAFASANPFHLLGFSFS